MNDAVRHDARLIFPGTGTPLMAFAHATGFCKEVWIPTVTAARARGVLQPGVAWDFRCHGDAETIEGELSWWEFADDVLAVVGDGPTLGVGHSMGGAALLLAELARPGTFESLLLIEPIVLPGPATRWEEGALAVGARKRKRWFPSRHHALDNYRGRGGFATWTEEALNAYVEGGFRELDDGSIELKCRPDREAEVFSASMTHGAFERLGEIRCPVRIVAGEVTDTHSQELLDDYERMIPNASTSVLANTTHFIPMERPDLVADEIASLLRTD